MSGGIQASLAGRYATALFALARDARTIDKVESSLAAISAALSESPDFKALTTSPLVPRARSEAHTSALQSLMRTSYAVLSSTKNTHPLPTPPPPAPPPTPPPSPHPHPPPP